METDIILSANGSGDRFGTSIENTVKKFGEEGKKKLAEF